MDKIEKTELATSVVKSLIGAVPFGGTALNEIVFDYRSRVKQERLNGFTKLLADFFIDHPDTNIESLKTEEFSDLFESVLNRVSQTRSKEKHKRFRDILTLHIQNQHLGTDNSEIYLDLVTSLNEIAINILKEHQLFKKAYDMLKTKMEIIEAEIRSKQSSLNKLYAHEKVEKIIESNLKKDDNNLHQQLNDYKEQDNELQQFRKAGFYELSADEFLYYKQILLSKGLLTDSGVGSVGYKPFFYMSITEFGNKFIEFLLSD